MKKEQLLLVVAAGVAGLLVWSSVGQYETVGAQTVRSGVDIDVKATIKADPRMGLAENAPVGRSSLRQKRVERRAAPPELEIPPGIGLPWVRPLPWPELPASFWGMIREPMAPVVKPATEKPDTGDGADKPDDEEDVAEVAAREAADEKAREEKAAKDRVGNAAKIVAKDGRETPVRLTPLGDLQGQEVWRILEKWPNVLFLVEELNADGKSVRGTYKIGPAEVERYLTVHFEKNLDNEYHEERIRRGVKDGDRTANVEFATWIRQGLAPKYGVPAVKLALGHLRTAAAIQTDLSLVVQIGETCQEAYDLDEEIAAYLDYLQGTRAGEVAVIVRLGDAYERAGAVQAARAQYEKAAKLGDTEGRLRLASLILAEATGAADRDLAYAEFEKCAASIGMQRARALAGMARVRIAQGNAAQAVQLAGDAKAADAASFEAHMALGAAQYATAKYSDAEQSFATAAVLERGGSTRARSNRAMALLALDKLPEAVAEAQACLDSDPLNFVDPLIVLGEVQQRWGDLNRSNDTFQTALRRHPRNAWVLLRLAAIRLRDGLPKPALDLARGADGSVGLLQVAPESVDALHVAGLACAAQETPDWPGAAKYLARALDKEPKNAELVFDLGKVLHLAGRSDEAIALLERATEPNGGSARNDARVLALLAYTYFDAGRPVEKAYDTFGRCNNAAQSPWTKDWVERMRQKVSDWDRTRIWEDDFRRTAGGKVGNQWEGPASLGPVITLDGDRCVIRGRMNNPVPERSKWVGIYRAEDLQAFQSSEVVLKAEPGSELVVHLYQGDLYSPAVPTSGGGRGGRRAGAAELGFGRDRAGKMTLYVYSGDGKLFGVPVRNADGTDRMWPDAEYHKVTFRRTGTAQTGQAAKGEFEILFDDERVHTEPIEVAALSAAYGKTAMLGIHVDADSGTQVSVQIESVQVEKILGRR